MDSFERRIAILEYLSRKRHATYGNLVDEFGVSKSTIREDIQSLIDAHLPLERVRGCYGGVRLAENFHFFGRPMNMKQVNLLKRLELPLKGEDAEIMRSILSVYASQ